MARHLSVACLLILAICPAVLGAQSVIIIVKDVPDDFFDGAAEGGAAFRHARNTCTVAGRFASASFVIPTTDNITVLDANSKQIPLVIEESSIHREFDEIIEMRFAFEIDRDILKAGQPRLTWGEDIKASNTLVEKIPIDASDRERYRTFTCEELPPEEGCGPQVATVEIIVDDKANLYYLWYLLPMGLVFGLLAVRKLYLGKTPPAGEK